MAEEKPVKHPKRARRVGLIAAAVAAILVALGVLPPVLVDPVVEVATGVADEV